MAPVTTSVALACSHFSGPDHFPPPLRGVLAEGDPAGAGWAGLHGARGGGGTVPESNGGVR